MVVTFANLGDNFVTVLPYGKSVLRDDRGGVYRILATKNWTVTDKPLFEGVPLAPNAQYTGSLAFTAPRLGDVKRSLVADRRAGAAGGRRRAVRRHRPDRAVDLIERGTDLRATERSHRPAAAFGRGRRRFSVLTGVASMRRIVLSSPS